MTLSRSGFRQIQIADSFSVGTLSQTVAAPASPPWAQGGTTGSSALRSASWVLVPGPASVHDGQLVQVAWSHKIGDVLHPSQWHFIVPPGQTSITFPPLPPLLSDHASAAEDNMAAQTRVFELPSVTDYDMLRTLPSANFMCFECAVHSGDLQRVVFTQLSAPRLVG